jgi:hypothetical protein
VQEQQQQQQRQQQHSSSSSSVQHSHATPSREPAASCRLFSSAQFVAFAIAVPSCLLIAATASVLPLLLGSLPIDPAV